MDSNVQNENQELNPCQSRTADIFSKENRDNCERYVLSIQRRLDKAVANGDKSRIRWYSHILTKRSRAVKVRAVYRVCHINKGKHTAGVDGIAVPKDRAEAQIFMIDAFHNIDIEKKPDAIRRVPIPKPKGGTRPLGIPTIKDRIIQDVIRQSIEPVCEYHFNHQSFGFRPKRSPQDAMTSLFLKLSQSHFSKWIVEGDIKGCFNNINHKHIISILNEWGITNGVTRIIKQMLKSKIMEEGVYTDSESGTPQGGIISPMLANVALTYIDYAIHDRFGHGKTNPIVRYADDFVLVAKDKTQAIEMKIFTKKLLSEKSELELSNDKTFITHIDNGFDFLGFNFRKYQGKLLIKPSKDNIQLLKKKIKETLYNCQSAKGVIGKLNPILIGWENYYRFVASRSAFHHITQYLWIQLWNWTRQQLPTRGKKYRAKFFFTTMDNKQRWRFWNKDTGKRLYRIGSTVFRRFIPVKRGIRVYDENAKEYWLKREYINAKNSIITDSRTMFLFNRQKGRCHFCRQRITDENVKETQLHSHHMKPRSQGGDNKLGNLRLLHKECHLKLHGIISRQDMARFINNGIDYLKIMRFA